MMGACSRFLLVALALLPFVSCTGKKTEAPKGRPPAPVSVAAAVTRTVPVVLEAVGTVEAYNAVTVRSQVSGEVTGVNFRQGQDVSAGQTLFTLDRRATDAAIRKAEANLTRLVAIQKNAVANADRYAQLIKDGIVTREQYETYRTQSDSAEADVVAAKAELDNLRVQLSYLIIKAPIAGRTGNLAVDRGNVVKANETPLVILNQIRPIYVTFAIPERELTRIRQYLGQGKMKVEASLPGDSGQAETGEVTFLDNTVDPATATIKLKGTFANPKTRLWPGQFVTVRLTLAFIADAVVVPTQAIQTGQQGQYVFVVSGDTAEMRPVKAGAAYEGTTVVEQGVKPGETVVIDGHMRVVPGGKVAVKEGGGKGEQRPAKTDKSAAPAAASGSTKP